MAWPNLGTSHRPVVGGRRGAVAAAHPLAALAGLQMLQNGGNAIDAAVAVAATLNVVEPYMSGAGGCGYMTISSGHQAPPIVLDYMGYAPAAAELDEFQDDNNEDGVRSPLVPGAVGGWLAALERYGTMDRATVFAPAIEYAENGYPVSIKNNWFMASSRDRLRQWPTSRANYLHDNETPEAGAILRQQNLARSFRAIVEGGADAFYRGPIGEEIVRFSQDNGGLITTEDLANYHPEWHQPISTTYRGYTVYCPPLPCSGMQYLITLNIVEDFDMAGMGQNSADYLHHLAEASKLAVADRVAYSANPASPIDGLLSKSYAANRRMLIDPQAAAYSGGERFSSSRQPKAIQQGSIESILKESTTHFVAIDASGTSVACTQSLGGGFGSGVVHGNTGIALNNLANWFDLDPESPNVIAPNKRIEMCMSPSQIWRDGRLFMMVGTPGSFGILQTTPQMMLNVIDHGFSIQAAIEAPRFRTISGYEFIVEGRVSEHVLADLGRRGHEIQVLDPWTPLVGGGQGIMVDLDSGAYLAGADPRRDGYAVAF